MEKIKCNNYDIYLIKTNKFKTIYIDTFLINDYDKKDITKEKFISEYLVNTSKKYNEEDLFCKKIMELYSPSLQINDTFLNIHVKSFKLKFLNEKYTEKGMNKKTIDFYYDNIFNPNTSYNKFDLDNFNITKKKFESYSKLDKENSSLCAFYNAFNNIDDDITLKIDTRINIKELNKLDRSEIYKYYINELKRSKFYVFVVGDYNDDIINAIKENLDNKVYDNNYEIKANYDIKINKDYVIKKDKSKFNDSIIYMIYKIKDMTDRERLYVLPILNNILGGSSSKLFDNIREKNSLAYYIYSSISSINNVLYISGGILKENFDKVYKLSIKQVNEIVNGNISSDEINNAKSSIYSSILKIEDNQKEISNSMIKNILINLPMYYDLKDNFNSVTKEEIVNLAKKLYLSVIYILEGK